MERWCSWSHFFLAYLSHHGKVFHRITEWFGLRGTMKISKFQSPCHGKEHLPLDQVLKAPSILALNTSRNGTSTASLDNLCQCLTAHTCTIAMKSFLTEQGRKKEKKTKEIPHFSGHQWHGLPAVPHHNASHHPPPEIHASGFSTLHTRCWWRTVAPLLHGPWAWLDPCWGSGVLGKHCKSEVLCGLLSVTGSCSSIGSHSVRHFPAPLATFASNQNTGSGLTSGLTGSKVQLEHSKEERATFSTCCLGEYAGKSIVVGISRSKRDGPSSHGPVGLPPQSCPCSAPSSRGQTEFWNWHKHLGKTLGKEKFKIKKEQVVLFGIVAFYWFIC